MPFTQTRRAVKLAFWFPGQLIDTLPDVSSLKQDFKLENLFNEYDAAFQETVGRELAGAVLQANPQVIQDNTMVAQLLAYRSAHLFWLAFLKSSAENKGTGEELLESGLLKVQLSGDSVGLASAVYAPSLGHLDDQISQSMLGAKAVLPRSEPMLLTPHDHKYGGMAASVGLYGWPVSGLVKKVNKKLGVEDFVQLVKHNSPKIKIVAGPREGLKLMAELVTAKKGKFVDNLSPYLFHHSMTMRFAAGQFALYLAKDRVLPSPPPFLTYVSNVTGEVMEPNNFAEHLTNGVVKPVMFYTFRGPSVHGAAQRNKFYDAVVLNGEIERWLRPSKKVQTHLVANYEGLQQLAIWLSKVFEGEMKQGKQKVLRVHQPPVSRATLYGART